MSAGGVVYAVKSKVQPILQQEVDNTNAKGLINNVNNISNGQSNNNTGNNHQDVTQSEPEQDPQEVKSKILSAAMAALSTPTGQEESFEEGTETEQGEKIQPVLNKINDSMELVDNCNDLPPVLTCAEKTMGTRSRNSRSLKYSCNQCPKQFPNKITLDTHVANHSDVVYDCQFCDKSFRWKKSLEDHMKAHQSGSEKYVCPNFKCTKTFIGAHLWKNHTSFCKLTGKKTKVIDNSKPVDELVEAEKPKTLQIGGKRASITSKSHQIEQRGLPIKKRGRPSKPEEASAESSPPEPVDIPKKPIAVKNIEKKDKPAMTENNGESSLTNGTADVVIKTERISLDSQEIIGSAPRSQRRRIPPKWMTENMVMDYDISCVKKYSVNVVKEEENKISTAGPTTQKLRTTNSLTPSPVSVSPPASIDKKLPIIIPESPSKPSPKISGEQEEKKIQTGPTTRKRTISSITTTSPPSSDSSPPCIDTNLPVISSESPSKQSRQISGEKEEEEIKISTGPTTRKQIISSGVTVTPSSSSPPASIDKNLPIITPESSSKQSLQISGENYDEEDEELTQPPHIELQQPIPEKKTTNPVAAEPKTETTKKESTCPNKAEIDPPQIMTNGNGCDQDTGIPFQGMPKLLNQIHIVPTEVVAEVDSEESSDSDDDPDYANFKVLPSPGSRRHSTELYIKDDAIKFLANKISNRNMLRIRQELLTLKQSGNYFKLTKTAPLAAGLIHDMFCQIIDSSPEDLNNLK